MPRSTTTTKKPKRVWTALGHIFFTKPKTVQLNFQTPFSYLPNVVIGISFQSDMHAPGQERTKTLTAGALAVDDDASLWKPLLCLDAETRSITINNTGRKQGFSPWMAKYRPVLHTGITLTCTAQGLDKSNACTDWWTDIHIQEHHSTYKNMKKGWIFQSLKSMLNQLVIIQLYTITVKQRRDFCNQKPEQDDYALAFSCRKSQRCFTVTASQAF